MEIQIRGTVNTPIQEPMILGFRLIKFLFTGCSVQNHFENVPIMILNFFSEILYIIH